MVAGAMSMAAGEYVSVHSQADTEQADLNLERAELKTDDKGEHQELAAIYVGRGIEPALAKQVAQQLMAHDALDAHARDELGISLAGIARPVQAAMASAASFAVGAAMPLLVTALAPQPALIALVSGTSLVFLAFLGGLAARAGGAGVIVAAIRVTFWGAPCDGSDRSYWSAVRDDRLAPLVRVYQDGIALLTGLLELNRDGPCRGRKPDVNLSEPQDSYGRLAAV